MYSRFSIVILFGFVLSLSHLDVEGINNLQNAKQFFKNILHNTAKKSAFVNVYELELTRHSVSLEQFNLSSEVFNYAGRIGRIIKTMENSLKMLVSWTEEEVSKYSWNPKLKPDITKYNDLRELKLGDKRLVDTPGFHFKIMPNKSGVHLPVEVYNGDSTVFHTLRWTDVLDSIFPTEPNLHFTYFASLTGILRVYPAFPWRKQNVDMFDVRRRSWSGSMTGQSLKLANLSAQKLIEALDVDDYFTVAHFPGAKDHVAPMIVTANNESEPICFNSFVQATRRNKMRLFYDLSTLKARGYSDFPASLKFAYEMFRNLTGSERGDRGKELRNKILVLMTDNAFVFDESVLSQLKQQKSNITTFIYSLGEPVGAAYEHKMKACATNDYYQYLPTVGAVSNLMKGTGLMVSISMPVYNRTVSR
ncbi:Voltage-dependent calcium channel subunit alpha-2/delta-1, variant 3 [Schistosoma haematobium]|uniref:Voltage-dependent calcium channel subunit alpha-2/delta-1, variant 3 n=1 Tax=Schistosoma haematobium TaxID=6185 RepID=A0A922ITF0_SCHHA|nr:Voltage-dependent calcium channel subunit alpha-2/delta-1, variant 3 [Schistosoma haematobium]KAH9587018.1 Voltage-dependent calcium channel subunit alpha-2/delta-1, variant 3 [Schistosoma haematobium]